ncbi:MAG: YfhO family protein [Ruminococcus flavefaciens]|nr:YfhO family protein [Ruminococcus flavefaciens]MCM1229043.1 YfhO family protein [Ruminococcus flavefaciens]
MKNTLRYSHCTKEKYLLAFMLGFLTLLVALLPVMIVDKGYFIYYGDFNAQQIPFYNLANDAVRSGQFGWNWFTDLGSDLLTSYSFYLIGSPFFWLSVILPRGLVTYAIPFLLAIKHGLASLTAYIYIRRFVRSKEAALTGALLYAFSGFQIFNLFFNHFQDVTALFPLMLIAMEENINNRRRGWFALIIAVMACMNYYFFTGQAVFLIIYFLMRLPCSDFHATWKKFLLLLLEAVLGTAIAGFILLPSAVAILGNYRVNERLYGENWIFYYEKSRVLRIIQSFFLPSDVPARPNLFKSDGSKWSSIGGYFPLFSMLGVITFMRSRKKHWAVRISAFCIICSFIPILNCMFYTFNASYYARWFYMPILIFAMMTAQTLDDDDADFKPAIKITAVVILAFGAVSFIPEKKGEKLSWFTLPNDFAYFWLTTGIAVGFLIYAVYIIHRKNKGLKYGSLMVYSTAAASLICTLATVIYGAVTPVTAENYINMAIDGKKSVVEDVSEDNFFRVDISENNDNFPMIWGLPNMRAFQSVVETSIMEFYDQIGIQRDVASRADISHYTLRGLLSVKYFYREKVDGYTLPELAEMELNGESLEKDEISDKNGIKASHVDVTEYLHGFELVAEDDYFEVYENKLYIPMGFAYDTYISETEAEQHAESAREKPLIKALILSDEQAEKYSDILTKSDEDIWNMTEYDYEKACREKQANCSDSFSWDSHGFESEITLDKPSLVFFSVPYSSGWSAEVNGEPVDVEKVSYGFMAVTAQEGENTITFRYHTPGLKQGVYISVSAVIILAVYLVICRFSDRKNTPNRFSHSYDYNSCQKITASELYVRNCHKNKED